MIRARHALWAQGIFTPVIEGLLRTHFGHFFLTNHFPQTDSDEATLITPNHFSWWDGFFIFHLFSKQRRRLHLMMLEEQLTRHWYFRYIGAYSIQPGRPRSVAESLNYTSTLLKNPGTLAVVYPQGEIQPYHTHPLKLQKGIIPILKRSGGKVRVQPLFFRIEYDNRRRPDVWAGFGTLWTGDAVCSNFDDFCRSFNRDKELFDERVARRELVFDVF